MLSPSEFRHLVSGRKTGFQATLMRGLLRGVETPYAAAVRWRNRRYQSGRAMILGAGVPVVSVGNLSLGGTGKTPFVSHLARWYEQQGVRVALVSRGYGAKSGEANDEALELAQQLPGVAHVQNPDRVAAAREAVTKHDAKLILLDDGFQHRRLARDLDIVLLDALEPFGFEHVFPRGTLREPLSGLARADIVALSRANLVDEAAKTEIRRRVKLLAPHAHWVELLAKPRQLLSADGRTAEFSALAGESVLAFCGIGNPAGFSHTLTECGIQPVKLHEFPDHHAYSDDDQQTLIAATKAAGATALVCTQKDLVKLNQAQLGEIPLWAVTIGMEITAGQPELENCLAAIGQMVRQ